MTAPSPARHADAKRCECGAEIEIVDNGDGQMFWLHVSHLSGGKPWDHAAVPERPAGDWVSDLLARPSAARCGECKSSVATRHLDGCGGQFHEEFVADYRGGAA